MGNNQAGEEDVTIARIMKARGIRGEVACRIDTDFPDRFATLERVSVKMPDGKRLALTVEDYWFHKDRVILKFAGYDTRTLAESLAGGELVIAESDARLLDEDEFYEYAIIGSEVVTTEGDMLGRVSQLLRTSGSDLLMVLSNEGREYMIPFVDDICTEVDVEAKRITVDPPEGLLEL